MKMLEVDDGGVRQLATARQLQDRDKRKVCGGFHPLEEGEMFVGQGNLV
jgi:hypothetical protein